LAVLFLGRELADYFVPLKKDQRFLFLSVPESPEVVLELAAEQGLRDLYCEIPTWYHAKASAWLGKDVRIQAKVGRTHHYIYRNATLHYYYDKLGMIDHVLPTPPSQRGVSRNYKTKGAAQYSDSLGSLF
jgi:hypothetical protein